MQKIGSDIDVIDLEKYGRIAERAKSITISSVLKTESEINEYYREERYDEFLMQVESYCENATMLAMAIKQGIEPYYKSLLDPSGGSFPSIADEMADAERYYNGILLKRNAAWVMEAECLLKLGKNERAIAVLSRALDLMTLTGFEEFKLWNRARNMLWGIIGYERQGEE